MYFIYQLKKRYNINDHFLYIPSNPQDKAERIVYDSYQEGYYHSAIVRFVFACVLTWKDLPQQQKHRHVDLKAYTNRGQDQESLERRDNKTQEKAGKIATGNKDKKLSNGFWLNLIFE